MVGEEIVAGGDDLQAALDSADDVRLPDGAGIDLTRADGFDDGGRRFQLEDLDVLAWDDAEVEQVAAQRGVGGREADDGDLAALEVGDALDGGGLLGGRDEGGILIVDATDDADVGALRDVEERGGGAEGAEVELAGADGGEAVGGVLELDQLDLEALFGEVAEFLGDEDLALAGHEDVAELDRRELGGGRCGGGVLGVENGGRQQRERGGKRA